MDIVAWLKALAASTAAQAQVVWDWFKAENIQAAVVAASAAILLFMLTQSVLIALRARDRHNLRRRLVTGLYAEIESNLKEIEEFTGTDGRGGALAPVEARMRSSQAAGEEVYRPLIVITESSRFFSASAASIPEIKTRALVPLMEFYRFLEELSVRRDAFESKAFATISAESRVGALYDLWNSGEAARVTGRRTLEVLKAEYRASWFRQLEKSKLGIPKAARLSPPSPPAASPPAGP